MLWCSVGLCIFLVYLSDLVAEAVSSDIQLYDQSLVVVDGDQQVTFDLIDFEERNFPATIEVTADRIHVLTLDSNTYIGNRVSNYCDALYLTSDVCNELYIVLEKLMFNPRAVVYDLDSFRTAGKLQATFPAMSVVVKSASANHQFTCLLDDVNNCLSADDVVLKGRALFSRFTVREIVGMRRVVFIHSTLLRQELNAQDVVVGADNATVTDFSTGLRIGVLEELLMRLVETRGLLVALDHIFVINYGETLPDNFTSTFTALVGGKGTGAGAKITFFQYSPDITRYEIPTMQIMHYFSKLRRELRDRVRERERAVGVSVGYEVGDCQVLYLHTKGVSYRQDHPEVRDWRDYMMYFLVERWENATASLGLLNAGSQHQRSSAGEGVAFPLSVSGQDDSPGPRSGQGPVNVVGVFLRPCLCADPLAGREVKMGGYCWTYIGNYWWTSSDYLATLPTLAIARNDKYDGEKWVTGGYHRRLPSGVPPIKGDYSPVSRAEGLLSLHASGVDHYLTTYPRHMYEVKE